MTHTVIIDEELRQKQMANMINQSMCRCRIGKVVKKRSNSSSMIKDLLRGKGVSRHPATFTKRSDWPLW